MGCLARHMPDIIIPDVPDHFHTSVGETGVVSSTLLEVLAAIFFRLGEEPFLVLRHERILEDVLDMVDRDHFHD